MIEGLILYSLMTRFKCKSQLVCCLFAWTVQIASNRCTFILFLHCFRLDVYKIWHPSLITFTLSSDPYISCVWQVRTGLDVWWLNLSTTTTTHVKLFKYNAVMLPIALQAKDLRSVSKHTAMYSWHSVMLFYIFFCYFCTWVTTSTLTLLPGC